MRLVQGGPARRPSLAPALHVDQGRVGLQPGEHRRPVPLLGVVEKGVLLGQRRGRVRRGSDGGHVKGSGEKPPGRAVRVQQNLDVAGELEQLFEDGDRRRFRRAEVFVINFPIDAPTLR